MIIGRIIVENSVFFFWRIQVQQLTSNNRIKYFNY
jgi:hypothetical protein